MVLFLKTNPIITRKLGERIFHFLSSAQKGDLRKQVSFENSLDEIDQPKLSQVNYRNGRPTTSILSDESGSISRKRSVTSNTSTVTDRRASIPHLKLILMIWSLALLYTFIDEQLVERTSELCSVSEGKH